jgi:hypothetical protein
MATCNECLTNYSDNRLALGYTTCLACGETNAKSEKKRKAKCIAPVYNKGAYQYIATKEQAKDIGRK